MLWRFWTQYASKFGKLSSGHRAGKDQFSFQSQRKEMPKNVKISIQLHSFHMPSRLCSKSFKLGFSNMWPENFHMYKLDWERQNHQRSNCQHPMDHRKSKRIPKKSTSASLTMLKPLTMWITNCGKFLKRWEYLSPKVPVCRSRNHS